MRSPIALSEATEYGAAEIGGKAASLARLMQVGFRVPDGTVLPSEWFAPWWSELRSTEAWSAFRRASGGPWTDHCAALQASARTLRMTQQMLNDLQFVRETIASWGAEATCAVRSSSPEEDLEGASFAGGYLTALGVRPADLELAVRDCFVSALDERVFVYKEQHGFDAHEPSIAVLIQRQLDSDVAGVAFSINPITNDFDEAVIDANYGLGETVVSGEVTPDHFIVDKPGRKILERRLGSKGVSRRIGRGGGVERTEQDRLAESCLTDEQVLELARVAEQVETLYEVPIDIEWAFCDGSLHLLQARPVTTYVPLPPEMLTEPGERRRLYVDRGLTDAFTTNTPLSRLTLDMTDLLLGGLCRQFGIPWEEAQPPEVNLVHMSGTRLYVDYSQIFWLISPQKIAEPIELMDRLLARTFVNVDRKAYKSARRPAMFSAGQLLRVLFRVLRHSGPVLWSAALAFLSPTRFQRRFRAAVDSYEQAIRTTPEDAPVAELLALNDWFGRVLIEADMAAIYPWAAAAWLTDSMRKRANPETSALLDDLNRGYEGELVVDMGIEMFAMTRLLDAEQFEDLEALAEKIEKRELPEPFLAAWDAFVDVYGCRGPMEMDLRSPRYGDTPMLLLRQMSLMARTRAEHDPGLAHASAVASRKRAYTALMQQSGWWRRKLLRAADRWIELYACERDTAKHHWVMLVGVMRRNVLALGARFVSAGRLDRAEDVFHLTWAQLAKGERSPDFDLRTPARETGRFFRRVESQVVEFPHLIDSRGRILRPAPEGGDGALVGLGISPGIARGPAKVLRDPYEKDVEPGDVLVAFTTDPGWTPLFVNASAIILQVGGVMQHGGVVAREYGKPCVAGIEHVLTRFEDGQILEVDGVAGTVRVDPDQQSEQSQTA